MEKEKSGKETQAKLMLISMLLGILSLSIASFLISKILGFIVVGIIFLLFSFASKSVLNDLEKGGKQ